MADKVTDELLFEFMKSIQAQIAVLREDMGGVKARLTSQDRTLARIEQAFGAMHGDFAELGSRMDRLDNRFERVETRLGLIDPTH